jgi:hypothetical protein
MRQNERGPAKHEGPEHDIGLGIEAELDKLLLSPFTKHRSTLVSTADIVLD